MEYLKTKLSFLTQNPDLKTLLWLIQLAITDDFLILLVLFTCKDFIKYYKIK